jgi:hypothetical protein
MNQIQPEGRPEAERPTIYDWVHGLILLSYVGGPDIADLGSNISGIARGPVEAKMGVYLLTEVSALGVMVRKALMGAGENVEYAKAIFISWAAVQTLELLALPGSDKEAKDE